jgi:NAD(P)-dependent dehydrogenase (short-subunit alcohol dehydrogenase family)
MKIEGSVALVTGANRGLGRSFATALLENGASKVYAGVRDPASVAGTGLVGVQLDVTQPAQVAAAAEQLQDVTIVLNNAGIAIPGPPLDVPLDDVRRVLDVNYFGILSMSQAFAPVLAKNGGGALVNMLSVLSWIGVPIASAYAASKAAAWSVTNSLRVQLRDQGTLVIAVHAAFIATDMVAAMDVEKITPEVVADATMRGIEAGDEQVLVDEYSRMVKSSLADDQELLYPDIRRHFEAARAA